MSNYPRLLIVSNNPFSSTSNNGKTLASFFNDYPKEKIAQLYFSSESPDLSIECEYFQISDSHVLNSVLRKSENCGGKIERIKFQNKTGEDTKDINISRWKNFESSRLFREFVWSKAKWNSVELNDWLNTFSPQIVFFCAGDSGFAYDIVEYIKNKYNSKSVIYITDDYILPRKNPNVLWWLRRNLIFKKMSNAVKKCDKFFTISSNMQNEYKGIFGVESDLIMNITEPFIDKTKKVPSGNTAGLNLVYTGGLHFNRYKTLIKLAKSIAKYNAENKSPKVKLIVYSSQKPSQKILEELSIEGVSEFGGSLNAEEVKAVLRNCDITVHVESFSKRNIESTRLSISTKISEYLSLGKPILAIGPEEIASIQYLKGTAYCISNEKCIENDIQKLILDEDLRKTLSSNALSLYNQNHEKKEIIKNLYCKLFNIM